MTKDKKQLAVVGVLVVAVLGIGAFQFLGAKPSPEPAAKKESTKKGAIVADATEKADPMDLYIEKLIASSSTPRDPFSPQAVLIDEPEDTENSTTVAPPKNDPGNMPRPEIDPGNWPLGPGTGPGTTAPGAGIEVVPDGDRLNGQPFALRGIMIGRTKKLCMLELSDGRQTLVLEGQSFGTNMESTVVRIAENYIVLRHLGTERTLGLNGGN
jgi:hypothetical protein